MKIDLRAIVRFLFFLKQINLPLSKGSLGASVRNIQESSPPFMGVFSQKLEGGIIDYFVSKVINPNKYFLEIGSPNGINNNTVLIWPFRKNTVA